MLNASVTINPVPSAGADIIVFNDINVFDSPGDGDSNNQVMFRNLVNFTGTEPRVSQTGVMFYLGHSPKDVFGLATMRQTITDAGFTITDFANDFSTPLPSSIKTVFLILPTTSFTAQEINNLKLFAGQGGRIVFIGEHDGYYGAGIPVENAFFASMGAQMTNVGGQIDCGLAIEPIASLRKHQVVSGLQQLTVACASEVVPGPNDYAFLYDETNTKVLAAVAKIDLTPITEESVGQAIRRAQAAAVANRRKVGMNVSAPTMDAAGRVLQPKVATP